MDLIELIKAIFFGIVEGITEWLPISSTGHMILLDKFIKLNVSEAFLEMFLVVIQLGAILAVVVIFWNKIFPFTRGEKYFIKKNTMIMWAKIVVACIPAAIVGIKWGDEIDAIFYNYVIVSVALIVFGIWFIWIENKHKSNTENLEQTTINSLDDITFKTAFIIGIFQLVAAIFPGTSRSGATIIGGLMLSLSRTVAAEFTFFMAVPVMFGASLLKIVKFGLDFSTMELSILISGMITAFVVSIISIKFLMGYIKKHDFKVFGWYRIILGVVVLLYFLVIA
ncbi:undecaprenyl-diphosphate phosphatase [Fusibacter bizertensis]|uniref:Undecaprenyl-diphosphatase n=1 Tax=Fusibacter bizertensis TaxID=1488331 RepID=A0ABT6NCZ9_9FIRM|nr:undecaprenyl-diphosphate phosphatase [Fusibacter bizertensis]MDH8678293.1 undecaprenyl-diphosphate phosphatase [Fusibacter bizertensis]